MNSDFNLVDSPKNSSETWVKILGTIVLDPDGWDRSNFEHSWNEKIDFQEFMKRYNQSTVRLKTKDVEEQDSHF